MVATEVRKDVQTLPRRLEVEPIPRGSALLLGAGSGLGLELAQQLSLNGIQVYAGTRSLENFQNLTKAVSELSFQTGKRVILPKPFIADIQNPAEVDRAFDESDLQEGHSIHLLPLAAGGMEPITRAVVSNILRLERKIKDKTISIDDLNEATRKIKDRTTQPDAMEFARRINVSAQMEMIDRLIERGNLDRNSLIFNTSSSLSHNCDPDHPESFSGPWFYYTIGMSKQEGVIETRKKVNEIGATHIDVVAPEISDTKVGGMIEVMANIVKATPGVEDFTVPTVTRKMVADCITDLVLRGVDGKGNRTLYVREGGQVTEQQPEHWKRSPINFF